MPRRCPPGVFCIENVTIVFIIILLVILGLVVFYSMRSNSMRRKNNSKSGDSIYINTMPSFGMNDYTREKKGYGQDVFFDIYKAPLRDDRCFTGGGGDIRSNPFMQSPYANSVPINVPTQECGDSNYRQVGILTRAQGNSSNSGETILPLMGRPIFPRRDKWNFYTLNDKNNMIKLPVRVRGRSGTDEQGCDNVYNGDTIYVEGYNEPFKVTMYDNNVMRYLPT
jgi:hypothetical protein